MKPPISICPGYWTREFVQKHPDTLFIFTDNTDRTSGHNAIDCNSWYYKKYNNGKELCYPNTTSACIRGLENAYPISLQKRYTFDKIKGNWNDSEKDEFLDVISDEMENIIEAFNLGNYTSIMYPFKGLFDGNIANFTYDRVPILRITAEMAIRGMELEIFDIFIEKYIRKE